jgi:hypothetical protein
MVKAKKLVKEAAKCPYVAFLVVWFVLVVTTCSVSWLGENI